MAAAKSYGNLNELRGAYIVARRAWATRCARDGIALYAAAAEGKLVGRGKARAPDEIKRLYDAQEAARLAWLGGGE